MLIRHAPPLRTVARYATDRYEMLGSAGLSPDAIAWSFDGLRQAVFAGSLVKIVEPEKPEFEVEGASVAAAAERVATMSHDGRFLVIAAQPSVFDTVERRQLTFAEPRPGAGLRYQIEATGILLLASSKHISFVGRVVHEPAFHVDWTQVPTGTLVSRDGRTLLVVPHRPPGGEWSPSFTVQGGATLALSLRPEEPYRAALCPGGNLAAIVARGRLALFDTGSGKEFWGRPLAELSSGAASLARGVPDQLVFNPRGNTLRARRGDEEILWRLKP